MLGKSKMFQKGPGDCLQPFLLDSLRPSCKGHRLGNPPNAGGFIGESESSPPKAPDLSGLGIIGWVVPPSQ